MQKEITTRIWVSIDGEYVLLDSLPDDKRKQILVELNDRSLRAIGYVPENEVHKPTA